ARPWASSFWTCTGAVLTTGATAEVPRSSRELMVSAILLHPRIFGVHRSNIQLGRVLRFMGMLGAGIDAEILELHAGQRAARHHAANGVFKHALGETAFQDLTRGAVLDPAGMAGVPIEFVLIQLAAGELHLVGIDDNNIVAHVHMRGEGR